ncbi:MAG: aryl sulfotransferase [Candidatus Azotimanducaceae bacterium]|jgi:aryl sulfotransferase
MDEAKFSALTPYNSRIFDSARWKRFSPRPDDIFVCTPAKCGTTWTQTIVFNLIHAHGDFPTSVMQASPWIEAKFRDEDEMYQTLEAQDHRRVMKSHSPADGVPWFGDAKYIFVGRDGRDAFMSMCNHKERMRLPEHMRPPVSQENEPRGVYDGDPHGFFQEWVHADESFFKMVASYWSRRHQDNVLFVHYADLKKDLPGEIQRIADYLEISLTADELEQVADRCSFEYMRNHPEMVGEFDIFEGGIQGFIFKGTNGRWRDVLTSDELATYDRVAKESLSDDALLWLASDSQ